MAEVKCNFILEQSDDHCSFHAIVVRRGPDRSIGFG